LGSGALRHRALRQLQVADPLALRFHPPVSIDIEPAHLVEPAPLATCKGPGIVKIFDALPKSGSGKAMWRLLRNDGAKRVRQG
jgi:hypothetical protein